MDKIIIVGHKNPDTDSVVAAIGAQEYFEKILGKKAEALRVGEVNNESKFVLDFFGVKIPQEATFPAHAEMSVALVDHNETHQALEGLDYSKVEYVIDHHKISISTEAPVFCRIEPIGSTSSLVAKMFFEKGIAPSKTVAGLLLAGLMSDTLNLTSPTTTQEDREIAEKLNAIVELNVAEFVAEMFEAKSSLEGISVEDVITLDYKNFEMGTKKVGVGTWETTNPASVNVKKDEILQALRKKKEAEKLDYIFFMVVDILQQSCLLYIVDRQEQVLAEKVFGKKAIIETMELPGVVSRKKQIIPQLTEELTK